MAVVVGLVSGPAGSVLAAGTRTIAVTALNRTEPTRSMAFGGAATALGVDASLVWTNPAALARTAGQAVTFTGQRGMFGELAGNILWSVRAGQLTYAFGAIYDDTGTTTLHAADGTERTVTLQQDLVGTASCGMAFSPDVAGGFTVKVISSRLFDEFSATAVAADAGLHVRLTDNVKLGVAITNAGTDLKYFDEAASLPSTLRGGIAAGWRIDTGGNPDILLLLADAERELTSFRTGWRLGTEYQIRGIVSVRGGVRSETGGPMRLTTGVGIKAGGQRIDYGVEFGGGFDTPHSLSLTFQF